jgi:hypothetical protein
MRLRIVAARMDRSGANDWRNAVKFQERIKRQYVQESLF